MSGVHFTNLTRPAFIPLIGKQALKGLATSATDSAYLNEKTSFSYNEKPDGVTKKAHSTSLPFTQNDIDQTLNSLLAYAKFLLALPSQGKGCKLLKEACSPQSKALIIKSEWVAEKAESIEVAKDKPLTAQRMRELLDSFPEAYGLLKEGRHLLTGQTSSEKRKVDQLFGQYKGQLKQLEITMRQGWYQTVRQEKTHALASASSLSSFTDEQVVTLTAFVNSLSTFAEEIEQSSQSLREVPSLRALRFWCGSVTAIGSIVAVSLAIAGATFFPVISLCVAILSATVHIGTHLYEIFKLKPEAQTWKERLNTLTNFTEQLKNLKEAAMASNLAVHGAAISTHGTAIKQQGATLSVQGEKIDQHDQKLVAAERKVEDLEAMVRQLIDKVDALEKEKTEGQSKANVVANSNSKHEAVRHGC